MQFLSSKEIKPMYIVQNVVCRNYDCPDRGFLKMHGGVRRMPQFSCSCERLGRLEVWVGEGME